LLNSVRNFSAAKQNGIKFALIAFFEFVSAGHSINLSF